MSDVTPGQIANFDQAHAAIAGSLDVLVAGFAAICTEGYEPRELTIASQGQWLLENFAKEALAEHLTVAVARLAGSSEVTDGR